MTQTTMHVLISISYSIIKSTVKHRNHLDIFPLIEICGRIYECPFSCYKTDKKGTCNLSFLKTSEDTDKKPKQSSFKSSVFPYF